MAKPTKYATAICLVLTVLAGIGIAIALATNEALWAVGFLAPTVGYEAYRTEGVSTRWASWLMAALYVALVVFFVFDIEYDLRQLWGGGVAYVGGEDIPLGDVKVVFPAAMAVLAGVLWTRTRGVYTRWLAAIIFLTAAVVVYLRAPAQIGGLINDLG